GVDGRPAAGEVQSRWFEQCDPWPLRADGADGGWADGGGLAAVCAGGGGVSGWDVDGGSGECAAGCGGRGSCGERVWTDARRQDRSDDGVRGRAGGAGVGDGGGAGDRDAWRGGVGSGCGAAAAAAGCAVGDATSA